MSINSRDADGAVANFSPGGLVVWTSNRGAARGTDVQVGQLLNAGLKEYQLQSSRNILRLLREETRFSPRSKPPERGLGARITWGGLREPSPERPRFDHLFGTARMASTSWTKDTVAVVTGSNRGIGYEIVKGLAKAGLTVVLTSREEVKGLEALKGLNAEGLQTIYFHPLAVNSTESVKKLAEWLKERFGGIDILINNAGMAVLGVNYDNAYTTFDTNYWGVQKVTEGLLPLLKPAGPRRVLIVSSQLGLLKHIRGEALRKQLDDIENLTFENVEALAQKYLQDVKAGTVEEWTSFAPPYGESKVLLNTWSRVLAKSVASKGIAVNDLCPGYVGTDMNNRDPKAKSIPEGADTPIWLALLPMNNYPSSKFFVDKKEKPF